ncbi:MAG: type II secretion system F family protein [Phycisphaerales bacterium]|nr:type II secretion system F family protein [Phycisphaerales bacterium]
MSAALLQSYVYQAVKPSGQKSYGFKSASDESSLAEILRRENLLLQRAWRLPGSGSMPKGMSTKDEVALNEQLETLLTRGVSLVEALEVSATVVSAECRPRVEKLREMVSAGTGFAGACQQVGGFDDVTIAVYRAAERTGDLGSAAGRLSEAARRKQTIAARAVTVMIYPAVIFTVSILLFTGILMFLVPMIAGQIRELGGTIPWFSEYVFSVGEWMRAHMAAVLLGAGGAIFLIVALRAKILEGLGWMGRLVPVIANLMITVEMARFFSVMAAMTRSGVPLAEALAGATGVISDSNLRGQLDKLRRGLVEGGTFRTLIEEVDAMPLATRRLLIAGERGGDLESVFDALSGDMSTEVERKATRLLAMLEPAAILAMFALLAPLIMAIAIPLMTIRTQVGQ